jgi:glycosyltransferase involved in cell wall biosynthesis
VLVLTDNRLWQETFGLIGCEGAACGALPVFTDRFAYLELWAPFADRLYLPDYNASALLERLERLAEDRQSLARLRRDVQDHARQICNRVNFEAWWRQQVATGPR